MADSKQVPWYLWPFWLIWKLVAGIILFTGRIVGAIVGLVLMIAGVIVSLTIVGLIVGIPLIIFGFLLVLRSLF
ncbi:MAG TPA: hypothetical protein DEQ80_09445 [Anaerolinea thermolimosa]|uniref:Uncharacterized protein n=1 Tax=Anaerolinea thermolimosa TaxID=229919 RepID=A0A3D1JHM1_9CHLR|nr:hypothetical protein [Anaerolinea thermolimosa]GAP07086.1 hypothetical protein ATHL_01954 [Anaerolinea thermolimosa]HCE18071.1 hypothetical protein [Anaerolinea thermolimosa]